MESTRKKSSYRVHTLEAIHEYSPPKMKRGDSAILITQRKQSDKRLTRMATQPSAHIESLRKLSPVKQYETKLRLSAQSWMVYDLQKQCYKRGWQPNKVGQYDGLIRLFVLYAAHLMLKKIPFLQKLSVRVNVSCLKGNRQKAIKHRKKLQKMNLLLTLQQKVYDTLADNTILKFTDLLRAMIMTGADDLLEYCIMFTGYIIFCHQQNQPLQQCCFIENTIHADTYSDIFVDFCNEELISSKKINLQKTSLTKTFQLKSTPTEICTVFLQCLQSKFIRQLLSLQKIVVPIKFQTGYKFWQDRERKFFNKRPQISSDYFCTLNFKDKSNFSVVSYNKSLEIVIVLEQCKFGMTELDVKKVEDWNRGINKPIVGSPIKCTRAKLKPLLQILEKQDPFNIDIKLS